MAHRQDLNTLSSAERQDLVDLMLAYIDDDIVDDHMQIIHSGVEIFTGHRAYIMAMENWLVANGGAAFVPLPFWNSANPIPAEFDVVKAEDDGTVRPPLVNLNPNVPMPAQYEWPAVCTYEDPADLGNAINGWHGSVHCTIGGTMCNIMTASAAPIFWCWHAFVDHIYWDWQRCTTICPDLVGSTLGWARHQLRLAGLTVGSVTRVPKLLVPPERIPFPIPIPLPDPPPFVRAATVRQPVLEHAMATAGAGHEGHDHGGNGHGNGSGNGSGFPAGALRQWRAHMQPRVDIFRGPQVIAQSPSAGVSVKEGSPVDLTVLV